MIQFITKESPAYNMLIMKITIVAVPTDPSNPNAVYHWRIYCGLDDNYSVCLDMTPYDPFTRNGVLIVSPKNYAYTNQAVAIFEINTVKTRVTCNNLVQSIVNNKLDQYMFTKESTGCRYWVQTIVEYLSTIDIIDIVHYNDLLTYIQQEHEQHPNNIPMPIQMGKFL